MHLRRRILALAFETLRANIFFAVDTCFADASLQVFCFAVIAVVVKSATAFPAMGKFKGIPIGVFCVRSTQRFLAARAAGREVGLAEHNPVVAFDARIECGVFTEKAGFDCLGLHFGSFLWRSSRAVATAWGGNAVSTNLPRQGQGTSRAELLLCKGGQFRGN